MFGERELRKYWYTAERDQHYQKSKGQKCIMHNPHQANEVNPLKNKVFVMLI